MPYMFLFLSKNQKFDLKAQANSRNDQGMTNSFSCEIKSVFFCFCNKNGKKCRAALSFSFLKKVYFSKW